MQADAGLAINSSMMFRLGDVFFPDLDDLISKATADLRLQGKVIDFTDSGPSKNRYAIIEVEGIEGKLVVPVERLVAAP
jgi:hypothetical protein